MLTEFHSERVLGSIVVSIPACHAGDRGSIPRRGGNFFFLSKSTLFAVVFCCQKINFKGQKDIKVIDIAWRILQRLWPFGFVLLLYRLKYACKNILFLPQKK